MARMTPLIKEEIIRLKTTTTLSLRDIVKELKNKHDFVITLTAVAKYLNKPEVKEIVEKSLGVEMVPIEKETKETKREFISHVKQEYTLILDDLDKIEMMTGAMLIKALQQIDDLGAVASWAKELATIFLRTKSYKSSKELQLAKLQLAREQFEFEKTKNVIEDAGQTFDIKVVNDVGYNSA